jgi:threonine/homoserine/homoserine lactone efflux protein
LEGNSVLHDVQLIAIGIGIGFMMSAPVGPVNILCIQRALERGFWGGLAAGLGSILCDGVVAMVAAAGITAISTAITTYKPQLKIFGGLVMIGFGLFMLLAQRRPSTATMSASLTDAGIFWTIPQTFLLTITNPGAVLGMFAVFGSVGTAYGINSFNSATGLVLGIVLGGLIWWSLLSLMVSLLRDKIAPRHLAMISRFASLALMVFGAGLLISVAWQAMN